MAGTAGGGQGRLVGRQRPDRHHRLRFDIDDKMVGVRNRGRSGKRLGGAGRQFRRPGGLVSHDHVKQTLFGCPGLPRMALEAVKISWVK